MTRQQKFDALVRDYQETALQATDDWASRRRFENAAIALADHVARNADRITVRSGR